MQYVNSLCLLNEGLFSVGQSLFTHMDVEYTCMHTDTQLCPMNFWKPDALPQPALAVVDAWFKTIYTVNSIETC